MMIVFYDTSNAAFASVIVKISVITSSSALVVFPVAETTTTKSFSPYFCIIDATFFIPAASLPMHLRI
jgi:hypothetical protein